jgi:hypothetical protein
MPLEFPFDAAGFQAVVNMMVVPDPYLFDVFVVQFAAVPVFVPNPAVCEGPPGFVGPDVAR